MRRFLQYLAVVGALFLVLAALAYLLYTSSGRYSPPSRRWGQRAVAEPATRNDIVETAVPQEPEPPAPQRMQEVTNTPPVTSAAVAPVPTTAALPEVEPTDDIEPVGGPEEDAAGLDSLLGGVPEKPDPTVELIDLRAHKGQWKGAMELCRRTLEEDPARTDVRLRLAGILLAQARVNEAYREAARVLEQTPKDVRAQLFMGELMFRQGLPSLALEYANKALSLDGASLSAKRLKARCLTAEGEHEAARDVLVQVLNVAPNDLNVLLGLSDEYKKLGDMDQARRLLEKAMEMRPDEPVVYLLKGHYHVQQGEIDAAIANYRKVLSLNKGDVVALNNLASLLAEEKNELEEAMQLASTAWQLSPGAPQVADTLGWVHYHQGDYKRAATLLAMAVRKNPRDSQVRYHLAKALLALGHPDQAEAQLTAALEGAAESFAGEDDARTLLEKIRNNELKAQ